MNRRSFLRSSSAALAGCGLPSLGIPFFSASRRTSRPNVLLVMADDMGFSDIGCYGGEIRTPNLDGLAERGVRFTQFYNTGRCCPTRASLLTGLYPHQAGVGHMVDDRGFPGYRGFLNRRCVTIAEALRPNGYRTLAIGKWHVGSAKAGWPLQRGFNRFYGSATAPGHYFRIDRGRNLILDNQEIEPSQPWYATDAFTEYALRFMSETDTARQPFFLYLAYTAPHWPLHALPADIAQYRGRYQCGWDEIRRQRYERMVTAGLIRSAWTLSPRDPDSIPWSEEDRQDEMDLRMAVYAAQIEAMDRGIGRVLDYLKQTGLDENTLLLFLSDNGGCAEGGRRGFDRGTQGAEIGTAESYSSYGLSWANASDTPFRRFKHDTHEGGIATPLIAVWPSKIRRRGELEHQPGHVVDLLPTILDVCGAAYPGSDADLLPSEGISLLPAFSGKAINRKAPLFWEHEGNRAIREGKWKLVCRHNQPWELYDLDADRTETKDLASRYPARAAALAKRWQQWADRVGVLPWDDVRKKQAAGS
jgi:arylsulfatase A-like enzyme